MAEPILTERERRWRLVLGGPGNAAQGESGAGPRSAGSGLSEHDAALDRALAALYDAAPGGGLGSGSGNEDGERTPGMRVGHGASAPFVARWLGDIRNYFPASVVRVMQQDALERLNLKQMLLEPELLQTVEADAHLVATLISLKNVIPAKTKATARAVVQKVVDDLTKKIANHTRQAVSGALNRSIRNRRPKLREIDWDRTIRANLRHYQREYKTIVPETRIGFGRRQSSLRDIVLCLDQSGSMAVSVVYASIFGAVLASLPAVSTHMVVYDTAVVDLTADLHDPVDLLFGAQLGGGNDTPLALAYCQSLVRRPTETVFVLISDLYEGAGSEEMIRRIGAFVAAGVQFIVLLALSDQGAPIYDTLNAARLAAMGVPTFACTPDQFPDMMAAALARRDLNAWAASAGIVTAGAVGAKGGGFDALL